MKKIKKKKGHRKGGCRRTAGGGSFPPRPVWRYQGKVGYGGYDAGVDESAAEEMVWPEYSIEELKHKLQKALQGTSITSAPGPDGISYHFIIKAFRDAVFREELLMQLAEELQKGKNGNYQKW